VANHCERWRTTANGGEPLRTVANHCERWRTTANGGEPLRTVANHCERWRTDANRCERWRTLANGCESSRTAIFRSFFEVTNGRNNSFKSKRFQLNVNFSKIIYVKTLLIRIREKCFCFMRYLLIISKRKSRINIDVTK
jgi:hypothetical protein